MPEHVERTFERDRPVIRHARFTGGQHGVRGACPQMVADRIEGVFRG